MLADVERVVSATQRHVVGWDEIGNLLAQLGAHCLQQVHCAARGSVAVSGSTVCKPRSSLKSRARRSRRPAPEIGHCRTITAAQPAGRPVTAYSSKPASCNRNSAEYAASLSLLWSSSVSSKSNSKPCKRARASSGNFSIGSMCQPVTTSTSSEHKYRPSGNAAGTGWSGPWKKRSRTKACAPTSRARAPPRASAHDAIAAEHEHTTSSPPGRVARQPAGRELPHIDERAVSRSARGRKLRRSQITRS